MTIKCVISFVFALCLCSSPALSQTVWDSGHKDASITLSNGNLTATSSASGVWKSAYATANARHTGKWYFRIKANAFDASSGWMGGVGNASGTTTNYCGSTTNGISGQQRASNGVWRNGGSIGNMQQLAAAGDFVVVAVDLGGNLFWITVMTVAGTLNTAWNNSALNSPASGVGGFDMSTINDGVAVFPCMSGFTSGGTADVATLDTTTVVSDSTLATFSIWDGTAGGGVEAGSLLLKGIGH